MSNLSKKISKSDLQKLNPLEVSENEAVQEKFIAMYNSIHGAQKGEMVYAKETFNFKKLISENGELQKCTPISLYSVFLDLAMMGLSLEQGSKPLAYVISRNANIGSKEAPQWEKRAYLVVSPYGELVMRMRAGQIKYADNPVIVYEGDVFGIYIDDDGNKKVRYESIIPRKSKKIVAAFIKIVRHDNTVDYHYLTIEDVERLKGFSEKNNRGKANALYTSNGGQIDSGFLAGKMIKHAFSSYPKINISGMSTIAETEIEDVDYGIEIEKPVEIVDGPAKEAEQIEEAEYTEDTF